MVGRDGEGLPSRSAGEPPRINGKRLATISNGAFPRVARCCSSAAAAAALMMMTASETKLGSVVRGVRSQALLRKYRDRGGRRWETAGSFAVPRGTPRSVWNAPGGSVVGVAHRATDAAAAAASSVRVWRPFVVRGLNGRLGRWDVAAA